MYDNRIRNSDFHWIKHIRTIFVKCGMINIWESHDFPNTLWLKKSVQMKLTDLFINEWYSTLNTSRKCCSYRLFKEHFEFEEYLVKTPANLLKYLVKFRTRNNRLPSNS